MTTTPTMIQRMTWTLFGKPQEVLREEEAIRWGIPYHRRQFWPAYYVFDKKPIADGIKHHVGDHGYICPGLYGAKNVGDIVPVFEGHGLLFMYRVDGFSWASGDDHIVSPRQFNITFVGTETQVS